MSEVTVHIRVEDANGRYADVRVTDFIRIGDLIAEKINVTAAEAASMAHASLSLPPVTKTAHRDKTRGLR